MNTQTDAAVKDEAIRPAASMRSVKPFALVKRYPNVVILAALVLLFGLISPSFLTAGNWQDILLSEAVTAAITFAALVPLVVGEFDLSLGYMVGFITMLGAWIAKNGGGWQEMVIVMCVAGACMGIINGILVVVFKISSFIATLGVGIILSGVTLGLSNGEVLFENIPQQILHIGSQSFLGIAIAAWLIFALAVVLFYVYEHTPLGRRWYAVGASERVAFLAGVKTGTLKVLAFAVAGLIVGFGAILELASGSGADPSFGPDLLLPAYAAVFLGVTTYRPGTFNVVGTGVSILLLTAGFNGLSLKGVPSWGQPLFDGGILLVAVMLAGSDTRRLRLF